MKSIRSKLIALSLIAIFIVTGGLRCTLFGSNDADLLSPVELSWWGTLDDPEAFTEIIADYTVSHPHIKINYRKLREEEFEKELLNALAEDRGPDIVSLRNDAVIKNLSKLEPLPASTRMAYAVTQKSLGIKEETFTEVRENPSITPIQLQNLFVDVVKEDVVIDGKIYGLPLSVDTLVLFYNRDLLNSAGIPLPPADWLTVQENIKRLTFRNQNGALVQGGIALGTAGNVENAADVLSLLMMQNGAQMITGKQATFGLIPTTAADRSYNPGPEAVVFYTDFANSAKEAYSWSTDFPNSIDAFAEGRVAMVFGYQRHINYLEAKRAGKLNYGIAKVPQIQIQGRAEINYASYWVQAVTQKSKNKNEAWEFVQLLTRHDQAKKYTEKTKRPAALRSLIQEQLSNDEVQLFANQALTAKSWYRGNDPDAMRSAFNQLIETVRQGGILRDAVELAAQRIQQTL